MQIDESDVGCPRVYANRLSEIEQKDDIACQQKLELEEEEQENLNVEKDEVEEQEEDEAEELEEDEAEESEEEEEEMEEEEEEMEEEDEEDMEAHLGGIIFADQDINDEVAHDIQGVRVNHNDLEDDIDDALENIAEALLDQNFFEVDAQHDFGVESDDGREFSVYSFDPLDLEEGAINLTKHFEEEMNIPAGCTRDLEFGKA